MRSKRLLAGFRLFWIEWLLIMLAVFISSRLALLDFDPRQLQQTGEHNESATLPILAEIGLRRYGEVPLWNPYMLTGFPHAGDPVNHFWNPVATLPVVLWGGVNGMKVSIFLSLLVAAFGQWFLAHTFGVRGMLRLWAALLFAFSGGLAMLWWLGWYELFVGMTWFPWCFALFWRALHRHDLLSPVPAAAAIALVLTTGGGYYPLYLGVCLALLAGAALFWHAPEERGRQLRRAILVAVLGASLAAAYLVPLADGLRYTARDAPADYPQHTSQRIAYALFNYVIADKAWIRADLLGKGSSSGWLYIGALPLVALAFAPLVYSRFRWRRRALLLWFVLLGTLLVWHANAHTPVRLIYEAMPILYTFRLPYRLLIVATIPLILLAALSLQGGLVLARRRWRNRSLWTVSRLRAADLAGVMMLLWSLWGVYRVNEPLMFSPHPRPAEAKTVLSYLKTQDPGLYYINLGGQEILWPWVADAYELEMPVINFRYNRRVRSMDDQYRPESPFNAQPRYVLDFQDEPGPERAILLATLEGIHIWRQPDALPYAFSVANPAERIEPDNVREADARLDGPNRIVVVADSDPNERLVVLVSDYPGWRLWMDGQPAELRPLNGYLGAAMQPGVHTYVFEFRPTLHYVGVGISLMAGILCLGLAWLDRRRRKVNRQE